MVYRRLWVHLITGFFEPVFYLLSVRIGIGKLVGHVSVGGHSFTYAAFASSIAHFTTTTSGAIAARPAGSGGSGFSGGFSGGGGGGGGGGSW